MAIYHLHAQILGRSAGRSAIAAAAYRSGSAMLSQETGRSFDYTRKRGVAHSEIMLCENAPAAWADRATLWNAVQAEEKRSDAQLAREIEIALPKELPRDAQIELVRSFVRDNFTSAGMCADFSIHDPSRSEPNPHAHIMLTCRPLKAGGKWGAKRVTAKALDADGKPIPVIDPKTGKQKKNSQGRYVWARVDKPATDWDTPEKLLSWRKAWADAANAALAAAQINERIDQRSHEDRGIEQIPTRHEGIERKLREANPGIALDMNNVALNKDIHTVNSGLANAKAELRSARSLYSEALQDAYDNSRAQAPAPALSDAPDLAIGIELCDISEAAELPDLPMQRIELPTIARPRLQPAQRIELPTTARPRLQPAKGYAVAYALLATEIITCKPKLKPAPRLLPKIAQPMLVKAASLVLKTIAIIPKLIRRAIQNERREQTIAAAPGGNRGNAAATVKGSWQASGRAAGAVQVRVVHERDMAARPVSDHVHLQGAQHEHLDWGGSEEMPRDPVVHGLHQRSSGTSGLFASIERLDARLRREGSDLSRAAAQEEEATWVPGMDARPQPQPRPAAPAPAPKREQEPQQADRWEFSHQRPGLFIAPCNPAQREMLLKAGAAETRTAIGVRVLRVPLDALRSLPLDPADVTAYRSIRDADMGRAMSAEELRKAAGLGRGGGSNSDTNSNSFHL